MSVSFKSRQVFMERLLLPLVEFPLNLTSATILVGRLGGTCTPHPKEQDLNPAWHPNKVLRLIYDERVKWRIIAGCYGPASGTIDSIANLRKSTQTPVFKGFNAIPLILPSRN